MAVVGLACRLPGAPTPYAFWQLLRDGRSAIAAMPADRGQASGAAPDRPWAGGFLDAVDLFDAGFFGVSPREAVAMDPQQRLMLELSWEVLEDAGIRPETLAGSRTGVFVGAIWDDYAFILRADRRRADNRHAMTGSHRSIIANRISYRYGLRGPSVAIDTAQSSSLVAVHLACESLRQGECRLALAGGVNLILSEDSMAVTATQFGGVSPDGRCHTFDARANGFVRGEGGGMVLLKPLEAAVRDGDPVYCVIRGSAVNNDGATDGLTVPSPAGQEDVLRLAYARAGVPPEDVQYVELHGTGTPVGDPVEAAALGAALGVARPVDAPLPVGSAKTNVGHLEAAAGITGLLKAALSIVHRQLPPSLNFTTPNPRIDLHRLRLRVQDELTAWPRPEQPLVAGVSSFGMGGTNCHLVLAEAPRPHATLTGPVAVAQRPPAAPPPVVAWPVSGRSPAALRAQAERLREHVTAHPALDAVDIGYSLATTRSAFTHRAVVLGTDREQLLDRLDALARGEQAPGLVTGGPTHGGVALLFSGQGSQRLQMGRELQRAYPVFAAALAEVWAGLDPHLDRPLREVVFAGSCAPQASLLDQTAYTQPALFAVEVALYRLVESWGLRAGYLMGHSVGEIAAAHVAGVLSLPDACTLVAARGRLMQAVTAPGAMAAWQVTEAEARELLAGREEQVCIAAVNGPTAVVVSGDRDAVREATAVCKARGRRAGLLRVSHAFHSAHMDAVLDDLRAVAGGLSYAPPAVPIISNTTGQVAGADQLASPGYWADQARHTVRFMAGVRLLCDNGVSTFVEVGPDAALTAMARECLAGQAQPDGAPPAAVAVLRRGRDEVGTFSSAMAQAYVRGAGVAWEQAFAGYGGRRVPLPAYAFQRERYWPGTPLSPQASTVDPALRVPDGSTAAPALKVPDGSTAAGTPALARPEPQPARWLSAPTPQGRYSALLEVVRLSAAVVLGHATPAAIDPHLTFKELGFDSVAAADLSERLSAATQLPLTAALTFDHPTPAAVARHLLAQVTPAPDGSRTPAGPACTGRRPDHDPIVVVAMSCRFPGGVSSPEELWELVVSGGDAVGEFPVDRGWDLAGLYDPDPDCAGASYTRSGGFLYDAGLFDAGFFG
ncbi:MAG TPA: type I polyketide synthase, partial [Micromonosporaceae bacterium]|nr:type I polyketide synthase [Micromonosporaceae bacterium]